MCNMSRFSDSSFRSKFRDQENISTSWEMELITDLWIFRFFRFFVFFWRKWRNGNFCKVLIDRYQIYPFISWYIILRLSNWMVATNSSLPTSFHGIIQQEVSRLMVTIYLQTITSLYQSKRHTKLTTNNLQSLGLITIYEFMWMDFHILVMIYFYICTFKYECIYVICINVIFHLCL